MTRLTEKGSVRKSLASNERVALVYPNTYRVGMANLGFQVVYRYLNGRTDLCAERFFVPDTSERERPPGVSRSEESDLPLRAFPVIAFSVPFENDYPAIPRMLLAAGIPPLQRDRSRTDPLVIAGGISVSLNPEPLAPFVDLFFIGEVEDRADSASSLFFSVLADALAASTVTSLCRKDLLKLFRSAPSVYVPSAYRFVYEKEGPISEIVPEPGFPERVTSAKRLSGDSPVPVSVLFSPEAEFRDIFLLEVNRGCGRRCRFCAGGWVHHPVRYAPYERVRPEILRAIQDNRTIGLIGSDLAGHPELEEILTDIVGHGGRFSLSSIRPEGLTPRIIELLAQTGQKTATLAPEVASLRMKKLIGKEIPEERFLELVAKLVSAGIPNIRFYFMVGLPTETAEDVEAIADFVRTARTAFVQASRPRGKIGRIGVQVNPFVPKPWTPFQWAAMLQRRELDERLRFLTRVLRKEPNVVVRPEPALQAAMQGFLSRGDRRIERALLHAAIHDRRWKNGFKKESPSTTWYVYRERPRHEVFPWDLIDHGIPKAALWNMYVRSVGDEPVGATHATALQDG
jgi:radical SAM superfamily enzyme YgiQ (UPF0313 family)